MYKIIIIIPYFGKFPNYFDLWLKSVGFNSTLDWLLITDNDCKNYDLPPNLHISNLTLKEMRNKIQSRFDFKISLENAYKLCDYKPAYGYIFKEEIEGYDFWGFGDIDLIYGNLTQFITDEILSNNDRIFSCGHLSLIKNSDTCNFVFRNYYKNCFYYKEVFTHANNFTFDEFGRGEYGGFFQICKQSGLKIFNKILYADIEIKFNRLQCNFGGDKIARKNEHKKKHVRFLFEKGNLFQLWKNKNNEYKAVCYIHLQKRKMKNIVKNSDRFFIYPHIFSEQKRNFILKIDEHGIQWRYINYVVKNIIKKFVNRN